MARALVGGTAIAGLVCAVLSGTSAPAVAKDNAGAVVGGLIAGAVIGAAVASAVQHPKKIYVNKPPPPPPPNPWANAFSPKAGVTCYPAQQACYNAGGAYNANWTWKVYAR
jgi:hypothetical protein